MRLSVSLMLLLVVVLSTAQLVSARSGLRVTASNPLLRGEVLPRYAEISPEHVEEAVQQLVVLTREKLAVLEQHSKADFAALFAALGEIDTYFSRIWFPIHHLQRVSSDEGWRAVRVSTEREVSALWLELMQNPAIYRQLLSLAKEETLDAVQRRLVKLQLDKARLHGVALQGEARKRFNSITVELATLTARFLDNSISTSRDFQLILRDKSDIAGLPASLLRRAAHNYQRVTGNAATAAAGPWLITLDYSSAEPFMDYTENADLHWKVFRAYVAIATEEPFDNTPLIKRILQLRKEKAELLGFPNHAALVLSTNMIDSVAAIKQLLDAVSAVGYQRLLAARQLHEDQHAIDTEELRRYFPLPRVLAGLFTLLNKLFGISIVENTASVQVWHADVKFYQVHDRDGTHIASFYFDPYSRPQSKADGLLVSTCNSRQVSRAGLEIPVCNIIANFSAPAADEPALLDMYELEGLFHEFGHGMHAMLTTVDYSGAAGMHGVEFDAIEMPSQLLEKFIYLDSVMPTISAHVDSGATLPATMLARLRALKKSDAARRLQYLLFYSYLDLQLHTDFNPDIDDPLALMRQIYHDTMGAPPPDEYRLINNLKHIFASSYDVFESGYDVNFLSYQLGNALAADAFMLFAENGFDDAGLQRSGSKYRATVLAAGGSKNFRDIFTELRGHFPLSAQAVLKSYGLEVEK